MELTLTYQGKLPAKQRGISPVKAHLRDVFHPQIKAAIDQRLTPGIRPHVGSTVHGHEFITPATDALGTAVELDVLLLTPPDLRIGDADNRLKTLIDGLTMPANRQQLQGHKPRSGTATYCLLADDRLVQRVNLDTRRWFGSQDYNDSLVVITARIVLSNEVSGNRPSSATFLVL